jgi:hypothetical protein
LNSDFADKNKPFVGGGGKRRVFLKEDGRTAEGWDFGKFGLFVLIDVLVVIFQ